VRVDSRAHATIGLTVLRTPGGRVTHLDVFVVCLTVTDLAELLQTEPAHRTRRPPVWPILLTGPFVGCAIGIAARAWMRLIAEDPEFTWDGTIFIVGSFTIFGFAQAISTATRRRARRRWTLTIARVVGVVGLMPLFIGAGGVMMPTVVGGGLAATRTDWKRFVRWACLAVALLPVLFVSRGIVDEFGWSLHSLAGIAGLVALYGTIIGVARSTFAPQRDGWRLPRWFGIGMLVLVVLPVVMLMTGFVFR